MASVNDDRLARHVLGRPRREQQQGTVKVSRLSNTPLWDALNHALARFGFEKLPIQIGEYVARRERVDSDTVARPFKGETPGHLNQRRFRHRVRGHRPGHPYPQDRGDIDDTP